MGIKPYPKYKPSGLDSIDTVPEHWEIRRLKHIAATAFSNVDKHSRDEDIPVRLCNYTDVYYNDFITADLELMPSTASPSEVRRFGLKQGDVIVTKDSESWDDIAVPALVTEEFKDVVCGYHLALIRPHETRVDGRYLFRSFSSFGIDDQYKMAANGITRYGLGKYDLDNSLFLIPPLAEQQAIANFLDQETAVIDTLIAKKRQLIERLQEKRTTLISHAVTKGLDPTAPMKDSGVEWLGEIPEHWQLVKIKFIANPRGDAIKTGPFGSQLLSSEMMSGEIKVYNQRNVIDRDLTQGENYISKEKYADLRAFTVYPGDILITTRGTIGRCVIVPDDAELGILHPCLMRIQPNPQKLFSRFLVLLIQDSFLIQSQLFEMSNSTTIEVIYSGTMREVKIPLPDISEQIAIVAYLDREITHLGTLIERVEQAIERLKEYRTALISAAVTGKIDVRE
ncbi:MAG: restriction endonuclease subunit S [Anaerolineae bacterium]|nr:restriction endonuclease subunit S [Anaerolineae bacterium]